VTGRPILGDFLGAARRHLARTATQSGTSAPGRDAEEISASFRRLVAALAGYASDLTDSFGVLPDRHLKLLNPYARAALQAREALSGAAASLGPSEPAGQPIGELARRLDAAAVSLMAGRDLLQTHFASGRDGRRDRSGWTLVITSEPVGRALLAEIVALSGQAATAGAVAVPDGRPWPTAELGRRLQLACQWLALAGDSGQSACQEEPVSAVERDLLHAIPGSALPPRRIPDGSELVPELCAGVITTSERISHLAWTAARAEPRSLAVSVTSWRRIASAGTATSHHCHLLLEALAVQAGQHRRGDANAIREALDRAAADARRSRAAWLRAGRALGQVTTDVRWRASRSATEAADLAWWTGRLAFASPSWVPSLGPDHPIRLPENLAPAPADLPGIVAALHHTADALERLAVSSQEQVRGAASVNRILVPAKSLPDGSDTLDQFVPAPAEHTDSLLSSCRAVTKASNRTASAVAGIAGQVRAPSRTLAIAKVVADPGPRAALSRPVVAAPVSEQDQAVPDPADAPAGPVEARVRDLGVTSPRLLWRATGVDRLAQQVIADAVDSRGRHLSPAASDARRNPDAIAPGRRLSAAERGRAGLAAQGRAPAVRQEPEAER
jgi:hypothetical protein